jgi:hypothetical protein
MLPAIGVTDVGPVRKNKAVMRIEHRDGFAWTDREPALQSTGITRIQRVQDQRRKREVVNPIDLLRDLDLILVVAVHLHQHFHSQCVGLGGEPGNEVKCPGIMKQLVPGFLIAKPAASSRIARTPAAWNRLRICSR